MVDKIAKKGEDLGDDFDEIALPKLENNTSKANKSVIYQSIEDGIVKKCGFGTYPLSFNLLTRCNPSTSIYTSSQGVSNIGLFSNLVTLLRALLI